jgi:hypothetical protein
MTEFQLLEDVARRQATKYWGKYRGHVTSVDDPENRGRIRVSVPSVLGDGESQWAEPAFPYGGGADFGWVAIPPVDSAVLVEFIEGDASAPIWTGTFWRTPNEVPGEHTSQATKVLKTESGHTLLFDDTDDATKIALHSATDAVLELNQEGSISLTDSSGAVINLDSAASEITIADANGNTLTLSASGVTCTDGNGNEIATSSSGVAVKGTTINIEGQSVTIGGAGGEPLLKGSTFLSLFNSHVHPCTAPGAPSGPPMVPLTPIALTTKTVAS